MMQTKATMQIPLHDLQGQHAPLREELIEALARLIDSGQFILGGEVRAFEDEAARYTGTRHAIGCASGSDALLLALMALGIGAGDEVITSPFTFFATGSAIARLGAVPRFADIEPRTYNLDPTLIEAAITPRTKAIIPVHIYGQCADMDAVGEIAARHNLLVIEDAAQAAGAEYRGRRAGALGAVGCFSFYPTKNLGAAGDAGMLTTDDDRLAERLRVLRVHGGETEYLHREVGINSRLDALQAAVLRIKLPHLDIWSNARRERADTYTQMFTEAGLGELVTPPYVDPAALHVYHLYVVRVAAARRDALMAHLKARGIGTKVYYPVPLHLQECFGYLGHGEGDFPEAERASLETLALPVYPDLTAEQQEYVVAAIREFFG